MPRKAKHPRKKQKSRTREQERSPSKLRLVSVISVTISLVGLLILWPRVSVAVADPVDPPNRFSVAFTITNSGNVPLENVTASLFIGRIVGEPLPFDPPKKFDSVTSFVRPEWKHHSLSTDERFTVTLTDFMKFDDPARLAGADIAIAVEYQVWKIPITMKKQFRFITHRQSNGELYWYSASLE